jgi:hypothetical protein
MTRMMKRRGSGTWPVAKATVTMSACPKAMFRCDLAEVYYTYRVDGELYTGINEKPFISPSSGEDYVSRLAPGTEFDVRVKPDDPSVSLCAKGIRRSDRVVDAEWVERPEFESQGTSDESRLHLQLSQ